MTTTNKILLIAIAAGYVLLAILFKPASTVSKPSVVTLTKTDTLYRDIEILKLKRDTIKIKYETKINDYRRSSTTNKIQLFADRINR